MLLLDRVTVALGELTFEFSLSVQPGETLAIIGKSGAGKSTLLNVISGFVPSRSGLLTWNGQSLTGMVPSQRPVTCLFQSDNLFAHLSVRKNIALGIDSGLSLTASQWDRVDGALLEVGLAGFGPRLPSALSGGEQQRVALARCLVRSQPVLLLDEPYSALDSETRHEMLDLTRKIASKQNLCTLLVSHNREDAELLNARVLMMSEGELHSV